MSKKKVLVYLNHQYDFWRLSDSQLASLEESLSNYEVKAVYSEKEAQFEFYKTDIYFGWSFPEQWLKLGQKVRWIHTPSAGSDYIDSSTLKKLNLLFTTSHGYHGKFMGQHVLAFLLYFSRGLSYLKRMSIDDRGEDEKWPRDKIAQNFFDLEGHQLAIIGCGAIGEKTAEFLKPFGIRCVGLRRNLSMNKKDSLIEYRSIDELEEVLKDSKLVLNLLPFTKETDHFFNEKVFSMMKEETVFLNLGRGKTVDEGALLKALESNRIMACGLDVLRDEPPLKENPLLNHDKVLVSPHSSAFSTTYLDEAIRVFVEKTKNLEKELWK